MMCDDQDIARCRKDVLQQIAQAEADESAATSHEALWHIQIGVSFLIAISSQNFRFSGSCFEPNMRVMANFIDTAE